MNPLDTKIDVSFEGKDLDLETIDSYDLKKWFKAIEDEIQSLKGSVSLKPTELVMEDLKWKLNTTMGHGWGWTFEWVFCVIKLYPTNDITCYSMYLRSTFTCVFSKKNRLILETS